MVKRASEAASIVMQAANQEMLVNIPEEEKEKVDVENGQAEEGSVASLSANESSRFA